MTMTWSRRAATGSAATFPSNIWCYLINKNKAILDYVIRWLDSNIDEPPPEGVREDSANLKEKIELALDPGNTAKDIEDGNF